MQEPANLYEAVIALDSFRHREPAKPPAAPTLTQEQIATLLKAIREAAERANGNERDH